MSTDPSGPLILIVEDYDDNREIIAEFLTFHGFRVLEARTGLQGIHIASTEHPDLIIMDLSLPELDGYEATRRLRQNSDTASIPVVALTAHALAPEIQRAKDAGCVAVVTKPCEPSRIVEEIRRLLAVEICS